jgi:hypothetical protein
MISGTKNPQKIAKEEKTMLTILILAMAFLLPDFSRLFGCGR